MYAHVYIHIYMYLNATFIVQYYELIGLAYFTQATPKFTKHTYVTTPPLHPNSEVHKVYRTWASSQGR